MLCGKNVSLFGRKVFPPSPLFPGDEERVFNVTVL